MRNNFQINIVRRVAVLYFADLFNFWLNRRQPDCHYLLMHLIHCSVLFWSKKIWPHRYVVGEEQLYKLLDCCEYSSLTLQQNSANCDFYRFVCHVESKTI